MTKKIRQYNQHECELLVGDSVRCKATGHVTSIAGCRTDRVHLSLSMGSISAEKLLEDYEMVNGCPCGVVEHDILHGLKTIQQKKEECEIKQMVWEQDRQDEGHVKVCLCPKCNDGRAWMWEWKPGWIVCGWCDHTMQTGVEGVKSWMQRQKNEPWHEEFRKGCAKTIRDHLEADKLPITEERHRPPISSAGFYEDRPITEEWLISVGFVKSHAENTGWYNNGNAYVRDTGTGWVTYALQSAKISTRRHVRILCELYGITLKDETSSTHQG